MATENLWDQIVADLKPGDKLPGGYLHECKTCGQWFVAKKGAMYCKPYCNIKAHRAK